MKRFSQLSLAAVLAIVTFAGCSQDQEPEAEPQAASDISTGPKLVRVATIEGAEAFYEFERNVRLVQAQRDLIMRLRALIEESRDPVQRQNLQAQFDLALAKLNENNAAMRQTYGFTLNRNYEVLVERSKLYAAVNADEIVQQGDPR